MDGDERRRGQSVSVVIPAFNAERTLGAVLGGARRRSRAPRRGHRRRRPLDRSAPPRSRSRTARAWWRGRASATPAARATAAGTPPTGDVVVLPRRRRRAAAGLRCRPAPGRARVSRRDRRLCPPLRAAHRLVVGCAPADRDALPGARTAARRALRVVLLHARARARSTCASTRATAARTPSSAPTRSRAASGSSSTRATRRCTTTTATRSRSCAASSRASRSPRRASAPVQREGLSKRDREPRAAPLLRPAAPAGHLPPSRRGPAAAPPLRAPAAR